MTMHPRNDSIPLEPGQPPFRSDVRPVQVGGAALMTAASLAELRDELEQLRSRTRAEIAQRLGEARSYGDGTNNDEYHAVREEQTVLEARIASLADTIAGAVVVDPDDHRAGEVVIGSTMLIEDLASSTVSQYRLTSAHHSRGPDTISAASPVGHALIGATPGAIVTVDLPNGRSRSVRLVDVKTEGTPSLRPRAAA